MKLLQVVIWSKKPYLPEIPVAKCSTCCCFQFHFPNTSQVFRLHREIVLSKIRQDWEIVLSKIRQDWEIVQIMYQYVPQCRKNWKRSAAASTVNPLAISVHKVIRYVRGVRRDLGPLAGKRTIPPQKRKSSERTVSRIT